MIQIAQDISSSVQVKNAGDAERHLENVTDKNIQLLAENFIELVKKLN